MPKGENKFVGEFFDYSELPDQDDVDEVYKFKQALQQFLKTKEYFF